MINRITEPRVELLVSTPEAKRVAFTAIRTCYSPLNQEYLWNTEYKKYVDKNNDDLRLIKQIVGSGHTSTLEHINFTFAVTDVSRALLAQLTRHRIGWSYSVQSQRYVKQSGDSKHGAFRYVTPDAFDGNKLEDAFHFAMTKSQEMYDELISLGAKPEDARAVLPNAATTNITMTMNLRAFLDFYGKRRMGTHSQTEISLLAEKLRTLIVNKEPWIGELINDED